MRILVAFLLLVTLGACSLEGSSQDADDPAPQVESSAPADPSVPPDSLDSPESPDSEESRPDESDEPTSCAEVRAGIDAFNRGDLEETVSRFEAALPLAEAAAEDDPSRLADDLLEAVVYYAELPAEDYPDAVETPDFEKYKQITLSQCAGEGQIGPPGEPDVEV